MSKTRVLFLCMGNTARSQMAEAFLRVHGGNRFAACSAGLKPQEIDPLTFIVMRECGLDMRGHHAKGLSEFRGKPRFDYLITVCNRAERWCPTFPGAGTRLSWPFEDPARCKGTGEERLAKFREVRDGIERFIREWLEVRALQEQRAW